MAPVAVLSQTDLFGRRTDALARVDVDEHELRQRAAAFRL